MNLKKPNLTEGPWQARKGDVLNTDRPWGIVTLISREACIQIDEARSYQVNQWLS